MSKHNRILFFDLTANKQSILPSKAILGGKELGTKLLLEHNPRGVNPLSPENHLIFTVGILTNTSAWGASRYGVYTKSPLTGAYAESYSGGTVPNNIDSCEFDAIVIKGVAPVLSALIIDHSGARLEPVPDLALMETFQTEQHVNERFKTDGALVIGPAGENLVNYSIIANDKWRCAGRTGVGTVMGSKKLKGIAFIGKEKPEEPKNYRAWNINFGKENAKNPICDFYRNNGTPGMVPLLNNINAFPTEYWNKGTCEHSSQIDAKALHSKHQVKAHACTRCFLSCGRLTTIKSGPFEGLTLEGPEYETINVFGGLAMIKDIAEIAALNDLCDRLGLDTISTGNLVALTIEATKRGIISGGPKYNDFKGVYSLIQDISNRTGLGDVLADGIIATSKTWGLEDLAIHVKGLEPPGYDPRILKGMGLSYAVSPRGACHLRSTLYKVELSGKLPPNTTDPLKVETLIDWEDRLALFDCLILCRFYRDLYLWEELSEIISLYLGEKISVDQLKTLSKSVIYDTHRFNVQEGFGPEHDTLPKRFFKQPLSEDSITPKELEKMVKEYYKQRRWSY